MGERGDRLLPWSFDRWEDFSPDIACVPTNNLNWNARESQIDACTEQFGAAAGPIVNITKLLSNDSQMVQKFTRR
jgi:hypothetical protein